MSNAVLIGFDSSTGALKRTRNRLGTDLTSDEPITSAELAAIRTTIGATASVVEIGTMNVLDFGAVGNGSTDDAQAFEDAITAASALATKQILVPPGNYRVTGFTVPADVSLEFVRGAVLTVDAAETVTINGALLAGMAQIFAGSGTVALGSANVVLPQWFGAVGDGVTDDYAALTKAIAAAGTARKLYLPAANYAHSQKLLITTELLGIVGDGPLKSVLLYTGTADVDAAVEIRGSIYPDYGYGKNLSDIGVQGNAHCESALKLSRVAHCTLQRISVGGATEQFLLVDGGVLDHFYDVNASANLGLGLWAGVVPQHCIKITAIDTTSAFSNSLDFSGFICEGAASYGLVLERGTCQCTFTGGTVESCAKGIRIAGSDGDYGCAGNTFTSVDCEVNAGNDLEIDAISSGNNFGACLFLTGIQVESYNNVFTGCRCGDVLLTATSNNNTLISTSWNSNTNDSFSDLGFQNNFIGVLNAFTATRVTQLSTMNAAISISPLTVVNSDGDDDYAVSLESRVIEAGNVSFDLKRANAGSNVTTCTFGYNGQVGFGFPAIGESDARVAINGGLNVGAVANPGLGAIAFSNFLEGAEITDPAAPAANTGRLYFRDVGGKTQLCVRFATGAVQPIASEP